METIQEVPLVLDQNSNSAEIKNLQFCGLKKDVSLIEDSPNAGLSEKEVGSSAEADCSDEEDSSDEDSCCSTCSESDGFSLSGSTEHLLLVTGHPEVYRDLPDSELKAVQHKLARIASPQLECHKCNTELSLTDHARIARHVEECWSSLENSQSQTDDFKSAYLEVEALVDALLGIPNFELEDPADSFDMEMAREHLEECDLKKERLLFLCEIEGAAIGGLATLVSFDTEETVGDFTRFQSELGLYHCDNLEFKDGSRYLPSSTQLKGLLSGSFSCEAGGNLTTKVTGLGSFSMLCAGILGCCQTEDCSTILMTSNPEKVCSGCKSRYGRFFSKQKVESSDLVEGTEVLFNPRTFCSDKCNLEFRQKNALGESCDDCCQLRPLVPQHCECTYKSFHMDGTESSSTSGDDSSDSACSDEDCSACCLNDTSGNLADKSTSSKASFCSCTHCQNSVCDDTSCSVCLETSNSSANTSANSSANTSANTPAETVTNK